jgi:glutathione synthase
MITIGLIIDPLDSLQVEMDTSLLVVAECNQRQHQVLITTLDELYIENNQAWAIWQKINYQHSTDNLLETTEEKFKAPLNICQVIFMRKDPPFDTAYLSSTYILDYAETAVVNSPSGLRNANEKLFSLRFPELIPPSFISRNINEIRNRIQEGQKKWVIKPLNDRSGAGIFQIDIDHFNTKEILKWSTHNENEFVIVQPFLSEVYNGDKRIFLVNGTPIGWMNRVPAQNDFRANIHLGAKPEKCELTERDLHIIKTITPTLSKMDLPITCLDIIGDYLSEVNVTSPSGLPEINKITGKKHEGHLVDYLEMRAAH